MRVPFSFNQLNISRADIPCVLGNGASGTARSTQPVTLYITVNINITPPNLYNNPPSIPTEDHDSPEEATIPGRIQSPTHKHLLPLSHHRLVETGHMPQNREEMSPTSALHQTDEAMSRIVPIDRSDTWERVVGKIKWVMDTLGPIAEVRVIPI
jgi:hypothetical protein